MKLKNLTTYILCAILFFGVLGFFIPNLFFANNTKTSFALNTYTTITTYYKSSKLAAENAQNEVMDTEKKFSAYLTTSEVYTINSVNTKNTPIQISDELFYIIKTALKYSELSNGLFDITLKPVSDLWSFSDNPRLPSESEISAALSNTGYKNIVLNEENKTITFLKDNMQIDLGAIAKGYAADCASKKVFETGCTKAIIDLGGNICVLGQNTTPASQFLNTLFNKESKNEWRIGIQTPFATTGNSCITISLASVDNKKLSIVTSGAYERYFTHEEKMYHHILDPRTGMPAKTDAESVTIIGENSMHADALSTLSFMLPADKAIEFVKNCGYDIIYIDKDKKVHTTLPKNSVEITNNSYSFAN